MSSTRNVSAFPPRPSTSMIRYLPATTSPRRWSAVVAMKTEPPVSMFARSRSHPSDKRRDRRRSLELIGWPRQARAAYLRQYVARAHGGRGHANDVIRIVEVKAEETHAMSLLDRAACSHIG